MAQLAPPRFTKPNTHTFSLCCEDVEDIRYTALTCIHLEKIYGIVTQYSGY